MGKTLVQELRQAIEQQQRIESQAAIARGAGVDQAALNRFMRQERSIDLETAARLCEYLGLRLTRG